MLPAAIVVASLAFFAVVGRERLLRCGAAAGVVVLVTLARAGSGRRTSAGRACSRRLILVILFIPIRRYALPGQPAVRARAVPPARDRARSSAGARRCSSIRAHDFRRTGFEAPLLLIFASIVGSIVANPSRVAGALVAGAEGPDVLPQLRARALHDRERRPAARRRSSYLAKTLVGGGAVVAFFAIIEARTGINVFNHLDRVIPFLQPGGEGEPEAFLKFGSAKLRVFGSAQHPIALSAAFVMLAPLGALPGAALPAAALVALRHAARRRLRLDVSRTGIMMFVVVALVFLWLRPKETRRMWPLLIPALIVIKLVLPGTLGAIKNSFLPAGRARRRAAVDAGRERQRPARRPRPGAAGVAREAARRAGLRHAGRRR